MTDWSLATQIKPFDAAAPLANAARIRNADQEFAINKYKQQQTELGAEARGLQAYVGTPEFASKWAETADRLKQRGILDEQSHAQWRNTPSPLALKAIIQQTSSPELQFRQEEATRQQSNADRSFGLQEKQLEATIAGGKVPPGFRKSGSGDLEAIPGGPQDPDYIQRTNEIKKPPKELNYGDTSKLVEEGGKFSAVNRFTTNFKDEFGGATPGLGDARNWIGRTLPFADESAIKGAEFWQDYDKYKNVVRNDLFGSALTVNEQAAFDRADIKNTMNPKVIRENLKVQKDILEGAMRRKANSLVASGYNPQAISQAYGVPLKDLGVTQEGRSRTDTGGKTAPAQKLTAPTPGTLEGARKAIKAGADPEAVKQRMLEKGIDPAGL